ncbi:hypothetical protein [Bradyrhizobium sp. CCGB20]|uniref:hypothetical protein n=1 Tax=Bradyrhizobium sp. CCGB20 TaxID=2949633 RepID=UPI0020B413CE|nr:hypothetical protein [Bradyrhizobium sp. CCGB20]MCP3400492.1 hypothetical protein [Bradyrhizobium sp. CCGB20]
MANLEKWQEILNLEAAAKGLPAPYPSSPDEEPAIRFGALPNPEVLAPKTVDQNMQQIAGDVRVARNVGLAILVGKAVPGLFALWLIWMIFGR